MRNRITATYIGGNVWRLICQAHPWVGVTDEEGSPEGVSAIMQRHVDLEHPGEVFFVKWDSGWQRYAGNGEPLTDDLFLAAAGGAEWNVPIPAAVAPGDGGDGK